MHKRFPHHNREKRLRRILHDCLKGRFQGYVNTPYTRQFEGKTHLHFATICGYKKIVKTLAEKGANTNAQDIEVL